MTGRDHAGRHRAETAEAPLWPAYLVLLGIFLLSVGVLALLDLIATAGAR